MRPTQGPWGPHWENLHASVTPLIFLCFSIPASATTEDPWAVQRALWYSYVQSWGLRHLWVDAGGCWLTEMIGR